MAKYEYMKKAFEPSLILMAGLVLNDLLEVGYMKSRLDLTNTKKAVRQVTCMFFWLSIRNRKTEACKNCSGSGFR